MPQDRPRSDNPEDLWVEDRLAKLLAALMWDSEDYYGDMYERHFLAEGEERPDVASVELTEHHPPRLLSSPTARSTSLASSPETT